MSKKVILISIDGMRPDGLKACGNPYVAELEARCAYNYASAAVFPTVTLPCHFSMAHSQAPDRHGILTNTYVPQVRPVLGVFDKANLVGKVCAMFYGWEQLRDIVRPGSLKFATYIHSKFLENTDTLLTDEAIKVIDEHRPDLAFLYMVETDQKGGHANGWMSEEYKRRISVAIDNTKRVIERYKDEYSFIIMSDHGGHDRTHGCDIPEDKVVPLFLMGEEFNAGEEITDTSLLDIAPTIAEILGFEPDPEWEGRSLVQNRN